MVLVLVASGLELVVPTGSGVTGTSLVELGLPAGAMLVLVERDDEFIVPTGATELAGGDRLLILGDSAGIQQFRTRMGDLSSQRPQESQ